MHFVNNIVILSLTAVMASPALRGSINTNNPKVQDTIASAIVAIGTPFARYERCNEYGDTLGDLIQARWHGDRSIN